MSRVGAPVNLSDLIGEGVVINVDSKRNKVQEPLAEDAEDIHEVNNRKYESINKECIGFFDEDDYQEGDPFERIASKMFNLVRDGRIKKRILREGTGEKPTELARVLIHYNAYLEYKEEPFDSTYIRNKPRRFILNDGRVIAGLDFAVQSMQLNEKSQFMIHPDYAFGKSGLLNLVPANSTVLFEVELLEIVNSGAATTFEMLPEEQQTLFEEAYKYCMALCERAKMSFADKNFTKAIKDYNMALCALNRAMVCTPEEKIKDQELALKLNTNLLVCYTKLGQSNKGCTVASKIYDLTEKGELMKIPAKVYFNHAKCLRCLCDYDSAKVYLDKALKLEPRNPDLANEMVCLENDKLDHKKKQMVFAKALVGRKS